MDDDTLAKLRKEATLEERIDNLEREVAALYGAVRGIQDAIKMILVASRLASHKQDHANPVPKKEEPGAAKS